MSEITEKLKEKFVNGKALVYPIENEQQFINALRHGNTEEALDQLNNY
jgi:hypothetical protein